MERIKKIKNYLFAFIIPFVICLAVLYFKNILFEVENIYVSDLRLQHICFLNYLKNILLGEASIFYSYSAGMGNSMLSTIIFYCVSPINLLVLVIKDIRYAILFIYIIKISLSGLTMFVLLKSKTNKDNLITVLFSTCYALSSFAINYFFCVFWFDSLYLAPLVMLGIDKIFEKKKISLLYIVSLALAILCNIQMGFGLCVYSLIYYIYSYNINYSIKSLKKDFKMFKHLTLIFIISSLCAALISSGALFGFLLDYGNVAAARDIDVTTVAGVSNLGYILKNFFTVGNLKTDYYNNYEPFIYCGLVVTFFSILYLFNSDIDKKKRMSALGVILVFVISFCVNFINLFWHLTSPVLLNYRYSVYLSLFLTMLAYECYLKKEKLVKNDIIVLVVSLLIGIFMIVGYSNEVYVVYAFVFLILIFVLILLTKVKTKKFEVLLFVAVIAEIFMNGYLSIYTADDMAFGKYSSYDSLKETASLNDFDDNYRVMYNYSYTDNTNDTFLLNKNSSLRYFSSVINGNLINFFGRNYVAIGNNNYMVSAYESPLLISLLGNKYLYLTNQLSNSIYELVDSYEIDSYSYIEDSEETRDVYLYENPYALSLGYVIESDVSIKESDVDFVDYQNNIIKAFTGNNKDILIRLGYTFYDDSEDCQSSTFYSCSTYSINNNTNNTLVYVYTPFSRYTLNNRGNAYIDVNRPILISTLDDEINLTIENDGEVDYDNFVAVTYNQSNLTDSLSTLQENMLENIEIDGTVLTGQIDSSKSGILFLSIPYDNHFKIYVDGKKVKYYSLLDKSFIGLDIEEGKHDIKVEYVDENYKWYIIATVVSIIGTLVFYYFGNRLIDKKKAEEIRIKKEQLKNKQIKAAKKKKEQRSLNQKQDNDKKTENNKKVKTKKKK